MLSHIHIRNFALIDGVDVEFDSGMTALTGETGAGKSILIDALGLVLGDRAEGNVIRYGCERAEISVGCAIQDLPAVARWLVDRELQADGECQLRRVINRDGRSRAFINNQPVPLQSLRELGEQLVDIHGQHEHQSLLHASVQRQLLDDVAAQDSPLPDIAALFSDWKTTGKELEAVIRGEQDREARLDLLRYQLEELEALQLDEDETTRLAREHGRLANAGELLAACQRGLQRLYDDETGSAYQQISQTLAEMEHLIHLDDSLSASAQLLGEILVLVQECAGGLRHHVQGLDVDPERLHALETRIGLLHDLSRKHRCTPEQLPAVQETIRRELESLQDADQRRAGLQSRLNGLESAYRKAAQQLSHRRRAAAAELGRQVTGAMQTLGMPGGLFEVEVRYNEDRPFGPNGLDDIALLVSANPGQPVEALSRVASGGELSRISLAIQVISPRSANIPTLIFDEVDTGIGGGVAEIVGQKLRTLGRDRQVFCVTHLPQVAALANHQMQVTKLTGEDSTRIRIRPLHQEERIDELARMLGGIEITRQTREHAREMMKRAHGTRAKPPGRERKRPRRTG
jgi:DNA repair protein RecN (Recombination protein N)